jgi:hypothetical protein
MKGGKKERGDAVLLLLWRFVRVLDLEKERGEKVRLIFLADDEEHREAAGRQTNPTASLQYSRKKLEGKE